MQNFSKAFILIMILIAIMIVASIIVIIYSEHLVPDWSRAGMEYFTQVFSIPITLIGTLIVIFTLFLSYERTVKMDRQLVLTQSNNFINNYFQVADYFNFSARLNIDLKANIFNFFPRAQEGNYELPESLLKALHELRELVLTGASRSTILVNTGFQYLRIVSIIEELSLNLVKTSFVDPDTNSLNFHSFRSTALTALDDTINLFEFLSQFSPNIRQSQILELRTGVGAIKELLSQRSSVLKSLEKREPIQSIAQLKSLRADEKSAARFYYKHYEIEQSTQWPSNIILMEGEEKEYNLLWSSMGYSGPNNTTRIENIIAHSGYKSLFH